METWGVSFGVATRIALISGINDFLGLKLVGGCVIGKGQF